MAGPRSKRKREVSESSTGGANTVRRRGRDGTAFNHEPGHDSSQSPPHLEQISQQSSFPAPQGPASQEYPSKSIRNTKKKGGGGNAAASGGENSVPAVNSTSSNPKRNSQQSPPSSSQSTSQMPEPSRRSKKDSKNSFSPIHSSTTTSSEAGNDHAELSPSSSRQVGSSEKRGPLHKEKTASQTSPKASTAGPDTTDSSGAPPARRSTAPHPPEAVEPSNRNVGASVASARAGVPSGGKGAALANISQKQLEHRKKKLRSLLAHRKHVMERLQQGRNAAQSRIHLLSIQDPLHKNETGHDEIVRMKETTREINSLARKQSKSGAGVAPFAAGVDANGSLSEKRTSLTLRRGASVGKKMNAALSSLAPGTAQSTNPTVDALDLLAADVLNIPDGQISTQMPPAVGSTGAPTMTSSAIGPPSSAGVVNPALTTSGVPVQATAVGKKTGVARPLVVSGAPLVNSKQQHAQLPKTLQQQPFVSGPNVVRGVAPSSAGFPPAAVNPHQRLPMQPVGPVSQQVHSVPARSSSSSARPVVPPVVVSEAVALRDRRKFVEAKLMQLEHNKRFFATAVGSHATGQTTASPSINVNMKSSKILTKNARQLVLQGAGLPSSLPARRRTHWDVLLEEMRWLATDFIEERKWKECAAKTLGQACAQRVPTFLSRENKSRTEMNEFCSDEILPDQLLPLDESGVAAEGEGAADVFSSVDPAQVAVEAPEGEQPREPEDEAEPLDSLQEDMEEEDVENPELRKEVSKQLSSMVSSIFGQGGKDDASSSLSAEKDGFSHGELSSAKKAPHQFKDEAAISADSTYTTTPTEPMLPENCKADHEKCSNLMDELLVNLESIKQHPPKPKPFGVKLVSGQSSAVVTIEEVWRRFSSGSLLAGPVSTGKTFAVAAILFKNRDSGPHLVVCSSLSCARWVEELNFFKGLCVMELSRIHHSDNEPLSESTVVVTTYDELPSIPDSLFERFRTVVVDSRYSIGFRGSRPSVCMDVFDDSSSLLSPGAPLELSSSAWWEKLTTCVMQSNARTLLIGNFIAPEMVYQMREMTDRIMLEQLALRMAFLLSCSIFQTVVKDLKKYVLRWARSHIKRSSHCSGSKFSRVRQLFCDVLAALTTKFDHEIRAAPHRWETVSCNMTPLQLAAYERCCTESRSVLSRSLSTSAMDFKFRSVAKTLMKLRRICTNGETNELLNSPPVLTYFLPDSLLLQRRDSSSQPNGELAERILERSGKLKEMVRILVHDADVEVSEEVKHLVPKRFNGNISPRERDGKKVAILSVLPETQLLISVLLLALGLPHELLLSTVATKHQESSLHESEFLQSASWELGQSILSKFNDKVTDMAGAVNVVVASPIAVAGDHGGLGVEQSDIILLMDEDWSGRGQLILRALCARCSFGRDPVSPRFCRLVTSNSCEQVFLATDDTPLFPGGKDNIKVPWPVNQLGLIVPPKELRLDEEKTMKENWTQVLKGDGIFQFPGVNFFRVINEPLENVLRVGLTAPMLGKKNSPHFLPSSSNSVLVDTQVTILRELCLIEQSGSEWTLVPSLGKPVFSVRLSNVIPSTSQSLRPSVSGQTRGSRVEKVIADFSAKHAGDSIQGEDITLAEEKGRILDVNVTVEEPPPLEEAPVLPKEEVATVDNLLFYNNADGQQELNSLKEFNFGNQDNWPSRTNAFAQCFEMSMDKSGSWGSQGTESLVYFPPIFPRMLESSRVAASNVASLRSRVPKRAFPPIDIDVAKRARTMEHESLIIPNPAQVTEENAVRSDAAAVLLDLSDDYGLAGIGAIPLPRDSAIEAGKLARSQGDTSTTISSSEFFASSIPLDHSEIEFSNRVAKNDYTKSMVLMVSKKRRRISVNHALSQSPMHMPVADGGVPWVAKAGYSAQTHRNQFAQPNGVYLNGADGGKKVKKKSVSPKDVATQVHSLPSGPTISGPAVKIGDVQRTRLVSPYQGVYGLTLFEVPAFRAASARLRNKVSSGLTRLSWQSGRAFDAGPGLPLFVSKPHERTAGHGSQSNSSQFDVDPSLWTSVVKRLKNSESQTGDEAIEVAASQRTALRRSLVAPCRVDFGPFQIGFLSSTSGMTSISPPRPILGVTLPMGVKLPQTAKDQMIPWMQREEGTLQDCALRYGTNWTLVSRVLSGLHDVLTVTRQPQATRPVPRAAKSCREHWQSLARSNPTLAKDVRQAERNQRENATLRFEDSIVSFINHVVVSSNDDAEDDAEEEKRKPIQTFLTVGELASAIEDADAAGQDTTDLDSKKQAVRKRSFSAIVSARARKQVAPNNIPGVNNGGQVSVANSHPSHMQAVQSSVASAWTNGRTELWPLQLIDAADRQRAQTAAVSSTRTSSSSSHSQPQPQHSSSSRVPSSHTQSRGSSTAKKQPTNHSSSHHITPSTNPSLAQRSPTSTSGGYPARVQPAATRGATTSSNASAHSFAPPPLPPSTPSQTPKTTASSQRHADAGVSPARK